jgi:hypothetical protein
VLEDGEVDAEPEAGRGAAPVEGDGTRA